MTITGKFSSILRTTADAFKIYFASPLAGAIQFVENIIESEKKENQREIAIGPLFTGGANM